MPEIDERTHAATYGLLGCPSAIDEISCLPSSQRQAAILDWHTRWHNGPAPQEDSLHFWNKYDVWLEIRHARFARAVQGEAKRVSDLAAPIGLVRARAENAVSPTRDWDISNRYLASELLDAYSRGDHSRKHLATKLFSVEFGYHRNYQVWKAIDELSEVHGYFPTKGDLQEYLLAQTPGSFAAMPRKADHKGWTRLWQACGASSLLDNRPAGRPPSVPN